MSQTVIWTDRAKDELRAIDQPTAMRILRAVARLSASGEGDVKCLQGVDPPVLRLRVGDYRVRFHEFDGALEITGVKHRREAYR